MTSLRRRIPLSRLEPCTCHRRPPMTMNVGRRYRCQNPDCRYEIEAIKTSTQAGSNPRCCCGAELKKPYTKPVLKMLDKQPQMFAHIQKGGKIDAGFMLDKLAIAAS